MARRTQTPEMHQPDPPHPSGSQPPPSPPQPLTYETPDETRPASASPTEGQLEAEAPTIAPLDASPPHDPYAALRLGPYRLYAASYILAVIGGGVQLTAIR